MALNEIQKNTTWNEAATAINENFSKLATSIEGFKESAGEKHFPAYPVSELSETAITIEPNKFYVWGEVAELKITLGTPTTTGSINEYIFQFTSGSTATSVTLPDDIVWEGEFKPAANKTYQVSIINNYATFVEF